MSARQLRAARRREDAIAGVDDDASGAESEDAGAGAATRAGNPFAALLGDEDEDEDEEEHEPGQDLTLSWPQGEDPCKITFPF